MPTAGTDIRQSDPHGPKFGCAWAEYLWHQSLSSEDERTGEYDFGLYASRFGKRILFGDDQGFVWCERFATEAEAREAFAEVDERYSAWLDTDESDC